MVVIRKASGAGDDVMYHGCKVFGGSVIIPNHDRVIRSGKLEGIKSRMMQEVAYVLEAYTQVYEAIGDRHFEIHIDINSNPEHESHVALNDARGYCLGMTGKEPEFKPYALAASFAADAHAHGLLN